MTHHGDTRIDPYYWMKDRDDPEVRSYLEAENEYATTLATGWDPSPRSLFVEMRARVKEEDQSVPYRLKDFIYTTRYHEGADYPVFSRAPVSGGGPEVILDVNELAEGHPYCDVATLSVSEDQQLLAYALDRVGRRVYEIRIRDLSTGRDLGESLSGASGAMAWANDDRTLFYVRQDPDTLRDDRLYRHRLGTSPSADEVVFHERDDAFSLTLYKTKSRRFIMAVSSQTVSTEVRALDADDPDGTFRVLIPRRRDHEYVVDHYGDHFYIRTNAAAPNFRLVRAPLAEPDEANWEDVVAHRPDVYFAGCELFTDHLVVVERYEASIHLRVVPWDGRPEHTIDMGESAYTAYLHVNLEFETNVVRYGYTSLTTPTSVYDYDMDGRTRTLLKQVEVLGDFDPGSYATERLWVPARDGERIPVSLVYRRADRPAPDDRSAPGPFLLYGYGAYGIDSDPYFDSSRLSLLDRGFAYAIAHVRGGEELGRRWYDDGRLAAKANTFNDFADVAEHLVETGWTAPDRLYAFGGSAGGLLLGAVMNQRPELFHGMVAVVPFVDVLTTMLDPEIPLTTGEYDEWGDPNEPDQYALIASYSPYDNVEAKDYPHLLVVSGLHDSQVQYWEPSKWVAKLRALKTDDRLLLLRTNMDAGHGGASGRFESLRERAFEFAFLLALERERGGE